MTSSNDSSEPRKQRTVRAKQTIDSFWSSTAGVVTMAIVGLSAALGILVAFGAL